MKIQILQIVFLSFINFVLRRNADSFKRDIGIVQNLFNSLEEVCNYTFLNSLS